VEVDIRRKKAKGMEFSPDLRRPLIITPTFLIKIKGGNAATFEGTIKKWFL
jgi:hypothetical protein